jgi:hypothetical protein
MRGLWSALRLPTVTLLLGACQHDHPLAKASNSTQWCTVRGRNLDSVFAVDQAGGALKEPGKARVFRPVFIDRVKEGLLIRMVVAQPPGFLGGGGLVWIDAETGCAIVLIRYE